MAEMGMDPESKIWRLTQGFLNFLSCISLDINFCNSRLT